MALPPLELPPIERVALLPGGPFALWKRWAEIEHCDETGEKPFYAQGAKWTSEGRGVRAAVHAGQSCRPLRCIGRPGVTAPRMAPWWEATYNPQWLEVAGVVWPRVTSKSDSLVTRSGLPLGDTGVKERTMHEVAVSLTCLMMIVAPCVVAFAGRMQAEELE
jgi:hypothetical protein